MAGGLAGVLAAGIDSSVWYLAAPGFAAGVFGMAWLRRYFDSRSAQLFRFALLSLWGLATIRWCFTDELALGIWGGAIGILIFFRTRRSVDRS